MVYISVGRDGKFVYRISNLNLCAKANVHAIVKGNIKANVTLACGFFVNYLISYNSNDNIN